MKTPMALEDDISWLEYAAHEEYAAHGAQDHGPVLLSRSRSRDKVDSLNRLASSRDAIVAMRCSPISVRHAGILYTS